MRFTKETIAILVAAGWTPDRHIDVHKFVTVLHDRGYPVFEGVREFLSEFGGLRLQCPTGEMHFDVTETGEALSDQEMVSNRAGTTVCIVGESDNHAVTIWMDESGTTYGEYGGWFAILGESGEQTIELICSGTRFTEIRP